MAQAGVSGHRATEISDSIENAIREGRLEPGAKLPTVRALADQLIVSPSTVSSAYRQLRQRGVISTHGRGGTRVYQRPPIETPPAPPLPANVRDLTRTRHQDEIAPTLTQVLHDLADRLVAPGPVDLEDRLVKDFENDGIITSGVVVLGSAREALDRILDSQLLPGDRVAVEDPTSVEMADVLYLNGLQPVPVQVDARGPIPAALGEILPKVAACIITPRGHDPTGSVIDPTRASELRTILRAAPEVSLIEWDPLGPLAGVPYEPIADPDRARWAAVRSFEPMFGSRLGIAAIAGDPVTVARVRGRVERLGSPLSPLVRRIVDELLAHPGASQRLALTTRTNGSRRLALIAELRARGIASHSQAGPWVWVPVPDQEQATSMLFDRGWLVATGDPLGADSMQGLRISVARLDGAMTRTLADDVLEVLAA
ncbi:MAG: GntR family transcriptional regulator [Actinobacteria bacterium]|nr:GntR family transcriptional regulator [Actinomycetota bacterium]